MTIQTVPQSGITKLLGGNGWILIHWEFTQSGADTGNTYLLIDCTKYLKQFKMAPQTICQALTLYKNDVGSATSYLELQSGITMDSIQIPVVRWEGSDYFDAMGRTFQKPEIVFFGHVRVYPGGTAGDADAVRGTLFVKGF